MIVTDKTVNCDFCIDGYAEYKPTELTNTAVIKDLREDGWQITKDGRHRCPSCVADMQQAGLRRELL